MTAWLCRCDCGQTIRVPQRRLTTSQLSHQQHACDSCRAHPCEICGTPISDSSAAKCCSVHCLEEKRRRYQLAYYHAVRATDTDEVEKLRARGRHRWAILSPEEKLALSRARQSAENPELIRARARDNHALRMATDPLYAGKKTEASRKYREKNSESTREYSTEYARKRRAKQAEIGMLSATENLTKRLKNDQE